MRCQTRRAFLRDGSLLLLAAGQGGALAFRPDEPPVKIGLVTDVHYADADARGTRYYRESLAKMREAMATLNRRRIDVAIELGDFIDSAGEADAATETTFLRRINREFKRLRADRHYVLGNHCVSSLTKAQFLDLCERPRSYDSFDRNGLHCVLLDACFRKDGVAYGNRNFEWTDTEIPAAQREWLEADLKATALPTVVFVHQRLDLPVGNSYAIHSSPAVRRILEESGKVLAVFMGHSHKNEHATIHGIHYCVLAAMVEGSGRANSGYSVLNVYRDGSLKLDGFRKHAEHPLSVTRALRSGQESRVSREAPFRQALEAITGGCTSWASITDPGVGR